MMKSYSNTCVTHSGRAEWISNSLTNTSRNVTPNSSSGMSNTIHATNSRVPPLAETGNVIELSSDWPLPPFDTQPSQVSCRNGPVEIRISLDKSTTVAGEEIKGRLEIRCKSDKDVKLGEINVYLSGYEETIIDNRTSRRLFLKKNLPIQNINLPPSDAVLQGLPDEHDMWPAYRGVTFFDFSLKVARQNGDINIPGSYWLRKVGGIRYILSGTVKVKIGGSTINTLSSYEETRIVEKIQYPISNRYVKDPELVAEATGVVGWLSSRKGEVKISAECLVHPSLSENKTNNLSSTKNQNCGLWISGNIGYISLNIINESQRKVKGLKISLIRRLKTFKIDPDYVLSSEIHNNPPIIPVNFSRMTIFEKHYVWKRQESNPSSFVLNQYNAGKHWSENYALRGDQRQLKESWSGVRPSEKRTLLVDIPIPVSINTIRNGLTLDVSYVIQVTAVPSGSTPICLEIPITIAHPSSISSMVNTELSQEQQQSTVDKVVGRISCDSDIQSVLSSHPYETINRKYMSISRSESPVQKSQQRHQDNEFREVSIDPRPSLDVHRLSNVGRSPSPIPPPLSPSPAAIIASRGNTLSVRRPVSYPKSSIDSSISENLDESSKKLQTVLDSQQNIAEVADNFKSNLTLNRPSLTYSTNTLSRPTRPVPVAPLKSSPSISKENDKKETDESGLKSWKILHENFKERKSNSTIEQAQVDLMDSPYSENEEPVEYLFTDDVAKTIDDMFSGL